MNLKLAYILIILFSFMACMPEMGDSAGKSAFDKTRWKQTDSIAFNSRFGMTDDLMNHYLKKGMEKCEVLELLGKPNETGPFGNFILYSYHLGNDGLDPCYLNLFFDSKQKLSHWDLNCS